MEIQSQSLSGWKRFILDWLGPLVVFSLLINTVFWGSHLPGFLSATNFMNIFRQAAVAVALAMGTALVCVPNGCIDLSMPGMIALATAILGLRLQNTGKSGILIALLVCCLIGAFNGFLIAYLKVPSVLITLPMMFLLFFIARTITGGQILARFERPPVFFGLDGGAAALIHLLLCAGIAVGLHFLTGHLTSRSKIFGILPFVGSAAIAALAAYYLLARNSAAIPTVGSSYWRMLIFFWGALSTSRLLGRTSLVFAAALIPAYYHAILINVLSIVGMASNVQLNIVLAQMVLFVVLAFIYHFLRRRWAGPQPRLLDYGIKSIPYLDAFLRSAAEKHRQEPPNRRG